MPKCPPSLCYGGQGGIPKNRERQARTKKVCVKELMFIVFAIKSETRNYIYVGLTQNLDERLKRHNRGYERTTKPYRPFKMIHKEVFATRAEAREREKYLKSGIGKEFLRSIK
jgi:putative endonuclease